MKIQLFFCLLFCAFFAESQHQVKIKDVNFLEFLQKKFPDCIDGDKLDTICAASKKGELQMHAHPTSSFEGIQYFDGLSSLELTGMGISTISKLPDGLSYLKLSANNLTKLPPLPKNLFYLDCESNELTSLPTLPEVLITLNCSGNHLKFLPVLPDSLRDLNCHNNKLSSLPNLPEKLQRLDCSINEINTLSKLPNELTVLYCSINQLKTLPDLPIRLEYLNCSKNPSLKILPSIPAHLTRLETDVSCIPNKPITLQTSLPLCNISKNKRSRYKK